MNAGDYRTYSLAGRPVFAAPPALCRDALRRFQPSTPKRAAYRWLASLGMCLALDRFMSRTAPLALGNIDFATWLEDLKALLNTHSLEAAVFWPPQPERGRVYVHLFDGTRPVAFAKLCLDGSNAPALRREAQTLRELHALRLRSCRVPQVLAEGEGYLVLEPLPAKARPLPAHRDSYPLESVREYAGRCSAVLGEQVEALTWWPRYTERLDPRCAAFHDELMRRRRGGFLACRMHGDLSVHNCVRGGKDLWIFDWEESAPDAPRFSDLIGFEISLGKIFDEQRVNRLDFMLALAFRHAAGIPDAAAVIHNWRSVP